MKKRELKIKTKGLTLTVTPETASKVIRLCDEILHMEAELNRRKKSAGQTDGQ